MYEYVLTDNKTNSDRAILYSGGTKYLIKYIPTSITGKNAQKLRQ